MRSLLVFGGLAALVLGAPCRADDPAPTISWKKTVIDTKFRSEGVAIADVNKDGKMDIIVGELWYEAPDWKVHEMQQPGDYGDGEHNYSKVFCCWPEDINGDGWVDVIVIPFPGEPAYWLENPKGKEEHWKKHIIWHSACNETPQYADLLGNGKRVLIMGHQPKGKTDGPEGQMSYFTPGKDPTELWEVHPISEPGKPAAGCNRFSHGLGVGDVNGDGRNDVICTGGWWEQPVKDEGKGWVFHKCDLGPDCSDMHVFDVDNDGIPDILSCSAHKFGIWWHKQREDRTFETRDLFKDLVSETHASHFVDIDGDGQKDLVTGKRWWSHGKNEPGSDKPSSIYWFKAKKASDGLTTFTPMVVDDASGIGTQFVVADFNGDKLPDIITSNKRGVFLFEQVRK